MLAWALTLVYSFLMEWGVESRLGLCRWMISWRDDEGLVLMGFVCWAFDMGYVVGVGGNDFRLRYISSPDIFDAWRRSCYKITLLGLSGSWPHMFRSSPVLLEYTTLSISSHNSQQRSPTTPVSSRHISHACPPTPILEIRPYWICLWLPLTYPSALNSFAYRKGWSLQGQISHIYIFSARCVAGMKWMHKQSS